MKYKYKYKASDDYSDIILISDGKYLTDLFFNDAPFASNYDSYVIKNIPVFKSTCLWLDEYFSHGIPNFIPKIKINNLTKFRKEIYDILINIPVGETMTYSEIANIIKKDGKLPTCLAKQLGRLLVKILYVLLFHVIEQYLKMALLQHEKAISK